MYDECRSGEKGRNVREIFPDCVTVCSHVYIRECYECAEWEFMWYVRTTYREMFFP